MTHAQLLLFIISCVRLKPQPDSQAPGSRPAQRAPTRVHRPSRRRNRVVTRRIVSLRKDWTRTRDQSYARPVQNSCMSDREGSALSLKRTRSERDAGDEGQMDIWIGREGVRESMNG